MKSEVQGDGWFFAADGGERIIILSPLASVGKSREGGGVGCRLPMATGVEKSREGGRMGGGGYSVEKSREGGGLGGGGCRVRMGGGPHGGCRRHARLRERLFFTFKPLEFRFSEIY